MTVVALHPVIVHLECIVLRFLAVDVYLSVLHLKVIAFIHADGAFVHGDVAHSELQRGTLLRNPYRSVVVTCPSLVAVERIDVPCGRVVDERNALHHVLACLQRLYGSIGKRQISGCVEAGDVLHRDA